MQVLAKRRQDLLRQSGSLGIAGSSLLLVFRNVLGVILDHHRLELLVELSAAQRLELVEIGLSFGAWLVGDRQAGRARQSPQLLFVSPMIVHQQLAKVLHLLARSLRLSQ